MRVVLFDSKTHNRSAFICEEQSLTDYLQRQVSQDIKRSLAACFVVVNEQSDVIGYYTLTSESLGREALPEEHKKKVPGSYNAPVTLLGRLARDITQKGTNLGEFLLMDALNRSFQVSNSIGSMAVIVDPKSKHAETFYTKYGFELLPDSGKMFIPMKTLAKLFA